MRFHAKKEKNYLVLGIVLVVLVLAAVIIRIGQSRRTANLGDSQRNSGINSAQAESYEALQRPSWEKDDLVFGVDGTPFKIFVYEDYSDLYSANLADTLEKIRQSAGEEAAIIVRPFIASNSDLSRQAALAVACAAEQGKWKEMRALVFSQVKNQQFETEKIDPALDQLDLDGEEFQTCLTNKEKSERIDKVMAEAKDYSVIGAPTIFVGDEMVPGARPYDDYVDSSGNKIEGLKSMVERKMR